MLSFGICRPPKPAPAEEQPPADEQTETPVEQTSKSNVQAEPAMQKSPAKRASSNSKTNKVVTVSSNRVTAHNGRTVKPNPKYANLVNTFDFDLEHL